VRIVHLAPNLNFGGLQEIVKTLALGQRALGHDVSVLCWEYPAKHPELEQALVAAGVSVAPTRQNDDGRVTSFRKLRALIAPEQVDVLHTHNPFENCLHGAVAGLLKRGTKVVNTLHVDYMFNRFSRQEKVGYQAAILLSNRIVAVCDETGAGLRRRYRVPSRKLVTVENGIDTSRFLSMPLRQPRDEIVFGGVARMVDMKNHALLIEAFALARAEHPNIRLRLLGSGPLEPKLKELAAARGLDGAVEFGGFSHDVVEFLSGIDVFALPSKSEGLPLSLLEAIASGLPVVATDVGGVRKVVEKTGAGWVCASGDPEALKSAMGSAVEDAHRPDRAQRAREIVADYYSAERMTADYERVYGS